MHKCLGKRRVDIWDAGGCVCYKTDRKREREREWDRDREREREGGRGDERSSESGATVMFLCVLHYVCACVRACVCVCDRKRERLVVLFSKQTKFAGPQESNIFNT